VSGEGAGGADRQSGGGQVRRPSVRDVVPLARVARSVRGPVGTALLAGSLAVTLRLPFLHDLPYPDEGGLLVVAGHWHAGGPFLYGRLFVDRPPLLLLFFRLAGALGGIVPLRLLGLVLVLGAVLAAARAGHLLGAARGSVAASLTCAALLADPRLGTREVDAETVGIPLVLLTALLTLEAVRRDPDRARAPLLLAAGAAGAGALLVKQNLADALVFAAVSVVGSAIASRRGGRRTARDVGALLVGAAIPVGASVAWSTASSRPAGLWFAVYGFRIAAIGPLLAGSSAAQEARLDGLGRAAVVSGMAVLLVLAVGTLLRRRPDASVLALLAMLLVEVVGVAGGGYYWSHYLIGIVPATSLLVGRAVAVCSRPWLLGLAIAATLTSSVTEVALVAAHPTPVDGTEVGALTAWLDRAQRPGDTAVVLYGEASVFETTGLRPAYPYLWTLPQRVLDPHLTRLVRTLDRPRGPTFVVVRSTPDSWDLDPHDRVGRALARHYRWAARVAGDSIYVARGTVGPSSP